MAYGYRPVVPQRSGHPADAPQQGRAFAGGGRPDMGQGRSNSDPRAVVGPLLAKAIEKLMELLDQETAALRAGPITNLTDFSLRKSQALLELNRMLPLLEGGEPDPALVTRLTTLRTKLDTNSSLLQRHLGAVQEIADMITASMRDADSDGTYDRVDIFSRSRA